jgi:hypothetical protein
MKEHNLLVRPRNAPTTSAVSIPMKKSSSQEQEYEALVPFERMALPEHYRRSYIAKRQEFFCNIQDAYGLWRYFQMLDWNFQNELDHMGRLGGQESATPLALFSKAHAKIRIAIELAFARCTEEARPIMRDAIRLAVCAHRLRVDAKLQQIWRSKGDSVAADASFNRTFGKPKKTTLFKGLPRLYSRWMQLGEVIAHAAPQSSNDDGNCKPVIFDLLQDASLIEELTFDDCYIRMNLDANLLRNRNEAALLNEKLRREIGVSRSAEPQ